MHKMFCYSCMGVVTNPTGNLTPHYSITISPFTISLSSPSQATLTTPKAWHQFGRLTLSASLLWAPSQIFMTTSSTQCIEPTSYSHKEEDPNAQKWMVDPEQEESLSLLHPPMVTTPLRLGDPPNHCPSSVKNPHQQNWRRQEKKGPLWPPLFWT